MVAQLSLSVPVPEPGFYCSVRRPLLVPSEFQKTLRFFVAIMTDFVQPDCLLTPGEVHREER